MYLLSALHGHGTSCWPGSSGAPTECRQGTNSPSPSTSRAPLPMRVMIRMLTATYGESVISTPMWAMGEPSGPMEKGTTYMVRPFIDPRNSSVRVARISAGSRQLLVGPASTSSAEQMKVRSSTRATSAGSEAAQYEFGRLASLNLVNVPASTSSWQRRSYSSADPSHHSMRSGVVRAATSSTHARSFLLLVGGVVVTAICLPGIVAGVASVTTDGRQAAETSPT